MKFFLSLHSIQLIVISALIMAYLAMTAENRPNKTEPVQAASSTEEENASRRDVEPLNRGKSIKAIILQPSATGKILEARAGLETEPIAGQVTTVGDEGIIAESSENESATGAGQLLLSPRPTTLER